MALTVKLYKIRIFSYLKKMIALFFFAGTNKKGSFAQSTIRKSENSRFDICIVFAFLATSTREKRS